MVLEDIEGSLRRIGSYWGESEKYKRLWREEVRGVQRIWKEEYKDKGGDERRV